MQFPEPLIPARLIKRYKRFLADVVVLDGTDAGQEVTVHCPNPGAMMGLQDRDSPVWLLPARNPKRKLPYGLELVGVGTFDETSHLVGINTGRPNTLAEEAIAAGKITELAGYEPIKREVKYGENSRIDLLLSSPHQPPCYVEVKNVHLRRSGGNGAAEFPDCVTTRGAKHLRELEAMVQHGARAVMLYIVQRGDCTHFTTAPDLDPAYDKALRHALANGVEAVCYDCTVEVDGIAVRDALPIAL